jgi:acetolactate synthase I/II/III large subunit
MTKGSDLLVAALENEGVERIFDSPGEENLEVVESLPRSKIQLILTKPGLHGGHAGMPDGRPGV